MKNFIIKWLGIDKKEITELKREYRELKRERDGRIIEVLFEVLNGSTHKGFGSIDAWGNLVITLKGQLEQNIHYQREKSNTRVIEKQILLWKKENIDNEKFIDSVIERIKSKQL